MSVEPRVVVVDLTPVLPGGENGGAKIFVLELLRRLAERAPRTAFVLLTQAAAHEELATLDRPNMRRMMVVGAVQQRSLRLRLRAAAERMLPHLPGRARCLVGHPVNPPHLVPVVELSGAPWTSAETIAKA